MYKYIYILYIQGVAKQLHQTSQSIEKPIIMGVARAKKN